MFNGTVRCLPGRLGEPLRWRRARMIFVNSMSDLFHEAVPFEYIDRVFAVMALCPRHTFQVLTKRPERMAEYLNGLRPQVLSNLKATRTTQWHIWAAVASFDRMTWEAPWSWGRREEIAGPWPLKNVWLGTSCENQATADERIPHLLRCPAAVRFLSLEPLVGPVNWRLAMCNCPWPADAMQTRHLNARPSRLSWIRSIVQQCRTARVPVFVKQVGSRPAPIKLDAPAGAEAGSFYRISDKSGRVMADWPEDLRVREFPREAVPA